MKGVFTLEKNGTGPMRLYLNKDTYFKIKHVQSQTWILNSQNMDSSRKYNQGHLINAADLKLVPTLK